MSETQIIEAELRELREIIANECWLEGERRGSFVDSNDDRVRERVADIILGGVGLRWRERFADSP